MGVPDHLWHLAWLETWRDRPQERNFRSASRCARQVAAILAAPDAVVRFRGLWRTAGWDTDRLHWLRLDPQAFIAEHDAAASDNDDEDETPLGSRVEQIVASWAAYEASLTARAHE